MKLCDEQFKDDDRNELALFKCMVLNEAGHFKELIAYLGAAKELIKDDMHKHSYYYEAYKGLGDFEKAEEILMKQLELNPEALEYIDSLKEVKKVNSDSYEENLSFYTSLEEKIPKSTALKR